MNTLPIELLEKVLGYLPAKEATVCNLVSKTFYDVTSRVLTCKNPLTIDVPKLLNIYTLYIIESTKLKFKVLILDLVGISDYTFGNLIYVVGGTIGRTVTKLEISHYPDRTPLKMSNLIKLFKNLIVLKSITNVSEYLMIQDVPWSEIAKCKYINVGCGIIALSRGLGYLPALELTSNDLWSSSQPSDSLEPRWFLDSIRFEKNFTGSVSFFNSFRIKKLVYCDYDYDGSDNANQFLNDLLATQRHIEELTVIDRGPFNCESNLVCNISNMTSLKKLHFRVAGSVTCSEICALGNLKNLEDLNIEWTEFSFADKFKKFLEVPFPRLKILWIDGLWDEIKNYNPEMRDNYLRTQELDGPSDAKKPKLTCFFDSYPQLESLTLHNFPFKAFQFQYEHKNFPNLRKLSYWNGFEHDDRLTPEFFRIFPNLTELILSSKPILSKATMQALFESQIQNVFLRIVIEQSEEEEIKELIDRIKAKMDEAVFTSEVSQIHTQEPA